MATIIGEPINSLLQNQLDVRQSTHGSGVISPRTNDELAVLSANNSWIKYFFKIFRIICVCV